MLNDRPKWIAIGKQQCKLQTRSQFLNPRKRNLSHNNSKVSELSNMSLIKMRSAKDLVMRQNEQQRQRVFFSFQIQKSVQNVQNKIQKYNEVEVNNIRKQIISQNNIEINQHKKVQINNKSRSINNQNKQIIYNGSKIIKKQGQYDLQQKQIRLQNLKNNKIDQQQIINYNSNQNNMSENHVPFYLRNPQFNNKVHYQQQQSEHSRDQNQFGSEVNQSVVLQQQDLQASRRDDILEQNSSKINDDEQSQIIQSMSFASSSNANKIDRLNIRGPIVHFDKGGYNKNMKDDNLIDVRKYHRDKFENIIKSKYEDYNGESNKQYNNTQQNNQYHNTESNKQLQNTQSNKEYNNAQSNKQYKNIQLSKQYNHPKYHSYNNKHDNYMNNKHAIYINNKHDNNQIKYENYNNVNLNNLNSQQQNKFITQQSNQSNEHNKINKVNSKIKLQINQLNQNLQTLKIVQQTIIQQIQTCQYNGKIPIFINNQQLSNSIIHQLQTIISSQTKINLEKQTLKYNESISQLLNTSIEKGLIQPAYKDYDLNKKIIKIIKSLQQKHNQIKSVKQKLSSAQSQYDKTSTVLFSKLQQINQLKQELSKYKQNQKSTHSLAASQHTATFSPQFQKVLREKQNKGMQMNKQIQQLKQRNFQLMDQKQRLQQQVFTLQQKIIGVQMQVQQRVRQGIQQITPVIQQQMREQYRVGQKQKQVANKNQFFLQTIDTLSKQIKDLTQKCKYYQKHIRDQQKVQSNQSSKSNNPQQNKDKQYDQILNKRVTQLDIRQNTLMTIQNQLTFKDKKLKELENRVSKQSAQMEKRQRLCSTKQQEIQKYLQQLNARQQQLYVWEKQLNQQDKKITRKANQLQRQKAMFENQKLNTAPMINPYQINPIIESRNLMPQYSNQYPQHYQHQPQIQMQTQMQKPLISSHQANQLTQQPQARIHYQRPSTPHHQLNNYQPIYQNEQNQNLSFHQMYQKPTYHNMSHQQIRYHQYEDLNDQQPLDRSDLDISQLAQNRIGQKQKTQSMRLRPAQFGNSGGQIYGKNMQYRAGVQKLYLSSTYDKKSELVEEILAKRRNQNNTSNRNQSRSPISINRNPTNDMFKKSQVRRIKSPLRNDNSFHNLKDVTEKKLRQRFEKKRFYQKPSNDISDMYRPVTLQGQGQSNSFVGKKYPYQMNNRDNGQKQYTQRSFMKSSIPAAHNINQKLQKLKQQIKRQVRDLQ